MAAHEPRPEEVQAARLKVQWINHLLDNDPLSPALWFEKAVHFDTAMHGTIPETVLLERVLVWYRRCLVEWDGLWMAHHNRGLTLRRLNRHADALESARRALELRPDQQECWSLLIQTLIRLGRNKDAADAFQQAKSRGLEIDPALVGRNIEGDLNTLEDQSDLGDLYRDKQETIESLLKGKISLVQEVSDPQLFHLQFQADELTNAGLLDAAENLCIQFELLHGPNNLTRSLLIRMRALDSNPTIPHRKVDASSGYPLLDLATGYMPFELRGAVEAFFKIAGAITRSSVTEINDFDDQVRWHIQQLGKPDFDIHDPVFFFQPIPGSWMKVWNMALLNFLFAKKLGLPILVAYAATTLADFYARLGADDLPTVLYRVAADNAEQAGQVEYAVNALGKCAIRLKGRGLVGAALDHLERALKYENRVSPRNGYGLYRELAECCSDIYDNDHARLFYEKAVALEGIPPEWKQEAEYALKGLELIAKGLIGQTGYPPVLCEGLEAVPHPFRSPRGGEDLFATSRHELYDSLLQFFDNVSRTRQSIHGRAVGSRYYERFHELFDVLLRIALELGLPDYALMHLEAQKSIMLNNRFKYLVRTKPSEIPDALWSNLQDLVSAYRRLVEGQPGERSGGAFYSASEVADAITSRLWQCTQISPEGARRIRQKLALDSTTDRIECSDPERTVILEYFCGEQNGACFVIDPREPDRPEVVMLPGLNQSAAVTLSGELLVQVDAWTHDISDAADCMDSWRTRLDELCFQPLAEALRNRQARNICFIPHRALHVLPLNLMAQDYKVTFAPSLAALKNLEPPGGFPQRALLVLNPLQSCPVALCRNPNHDCYSIPGAEREGAAIEEILEKAGASPQQLSGRGATLAAVSNALKSAELVHFGTHGFFSNEHPEHGGLLLALPSDPAAAGATYLDHSARITKYPDHAVGEVLSLEYLWRNIDMFNCRFLNLSACSLALVDVSARTDEFHGIANGFLYAGVQSILSTLWPVHDEASGLFNQLFYSAYLDSVAEPANALHTALAVFRESFPHAFFWSGYRLIGMP